jgi:hypothetical protein
MNYRGQTVTPSQAATIIANRLKRRDPNYLAHLRDADIGRARVLYGNVTIGLLVMAVVGLVILL